MRLAILGRSSLIVLCLLGCSRFVFGADNLIFASPRSDVANSGRKTAADLKYYYCKTGSPKLDQGNIFCVDGRSWPKVVTYRIVGENAADFRSDFAKIAERVKRLTGTRLEESDAPDLLTILGQRDMRIYNPMATAFIKQNQVKFDPHLLSELDRLSNSDMGCLASPLSSDQRRGAKAAFFMDVGAPFDRADLSKCMTREFYDYFGISLPEQRAVEQWFEKIP